MKSAGTLLATAPGVATVEVSTVPNHNTLTPPALLKSAANEPPTVEDAVYDAARCFLGAVCKNGHTWSGSNRTLRYKSDRSCVACTRERSSRRSPARDQHRYAQRMALTNKIKLERGCVDCGYREHAAALQFDHLPDCDKSFTVSAKLLSVSMAALLAEIAKCEVVCANCHAIRTADRRVGLPLPARHQEV